MSKIWIKIITDLIRLSLITPELFIRLRQLQSFDDSIELFPIDHTHNNDGFLLYPVEDSIIA